MYKPYTSGPEIWVICLQTQTAQQQRHEREKREIEQSHSKIVKQLEARLFEVEAANKVLRGRT